MAEEADWDEVISVDRSRRASRNNRRVDFIPFVRHHTHLVPKLQFGNARFETPFHVVDPYD